MTGRNWFRLAIANRSFVIMLAVWATLAMSLSAAAQFGGGDAEEEAARAKEAAEEAEQAARDDAEMKGRQLKELTQQFQQAQRALAEAERAYAKERKAREIDRAEAERSRAMAAEAENQARVSQNQLRSIRAEFEAARTQMRQLATQIAQAKARPLPDDAALHVLKIRNVKADQVANTVHEILGTGAPQIAVDDRNNRLLLFGTEKQFAVVDKLVRSLGEMGEAEPEQSAAETLQLRIVWLLDGVEGKEPAVGLDTGRRQTDGIVSPQVVEALHLLGFEDPRVVCQQVTTMILDGERNHGQFRFHVPVLINGQMWRLRGTGHVTPAVDDRFAIQFELEFAQAGNAGVPRESTPQDGQLGGSIFTPLAHYTVLGTTTFVDTRFRNEGKDQQQMSAFVVYLDRAPEFRGGKVLGLKLKKENSDSELRNVEVQLKE